MRLLFFDNEIPDLLADSGKTTGGAAVRQYALAKGLSELDQKVGILTWKGANDFVNRNLDFELVETYAPSAGIRYFRYIHYFRCFYTRIKQFKPDFLFVKTTNIQNGLLALCARLLRIPLVYLITNDKDADDRYKLVEDKPTSISYQYALRQAKIIVCQNDYQFQQFHKRFPKKKFLIMYNPYFSETPLPTIRPQEVRHYISWIGVFGKQKNLPALLDLIRAFPDQEFRIAGSFPSGVMSGNVHKSPTITKALAAISECPNAQLLGYVQRNKISEFLAHSKFLLNTSHYEGFSNTFLEAFATGTPIVTTKAVDPDHIIEKNDLGRVADDHNELSTSIEAMLSFTAFDEMAARCQQYLISAHRLEVICQQLLDCLVEFKADRS